MTDTETSPDDVPARLAAIAARIARSAHDSGRAPGGVSLVAVSKTHAAAVIAPALEAGHRVFGENRVQEAKGKWPELRGRFPGVELHLIGPLQSNKAREAVETFDVIETVDRPKIAEALAAEIARAGKAVRLFVEVNTGAEPQKAGIRPGDADAFLKRCRDALGLDVAGLMCIPPAGEQASPHFALLAEIAAANGIAGLSMGMSSDFELGIQLGATHVRVGTAIFGARPRQP